MNAYIHGIVDIYNTETMYHCQGGSLGFDIRCANPPDQGSEHNMFTLCHSELFLSEESLQSKL